MVKEIVRSRKMGIQKLKWTEEEEAALLAGISRYGMGKWKNILRDPEFSQQLIQRSNVDLKDKWRNIMSVNLGTQAAKDNPRLSKVKDEVIARAKAAAAANNTPPPNANPSSSLAASPPPGASTEVLDIDDNGNIEVDTKNAPRFDGMIYEALSALAYENGSDVRSICNYLESKHEVPVNFRRIISSRLRRLAVQGKLIKTQKLYKVRPNQWGTKPKETPVVSQEMIDETPAVSQEMIDETPAVSQEMIDETPAVSQEMIDEASKTAAFEVAESENKRDELKALAEELDMVDKLAEECETLLEIAKHIEEQCSRGEIVLLA